MLITLQQQCSHGNHVGIYDGDHDASDGGNVGDDGDSGGSGDSGSGDGGDNSSGGGGGSGEDDGSSGEGDIFRMKDEWFNMLDGRKA